jgi:hypothetical protein
MQEAGATKRAQIASGTQIKTQEMQNQAALQAQAASDEAQDKRAAEIERGRRDDQQFEKFMSETQQKFATDMDALQREREVADKADDREYAEKIQKKIDAKADLQAILDRRAAKGNVNAFITALGGMRNNEAKMEEAKSALVVKGDEYEKATGLYDELITDTTRRIEDDKRMDRPILEGLKGEVPSVWDVTKGMMTKGPILGGYKPIQKIRSIKEKVKEGVADPRGVLQTQLTENGVPFSAEAATPDKIHELRGMIEAGTVQKEDITTAIGVFTGAAASFKAKEDAEGTPAEDKKFWRQHRVEVEDMKRAITRLRHDKSPLQNSPNQNVGTIVGDALSVTGPLYATSLGAQAAELKSQFGTGHDAWIKALSAAFDPLGPIEIQEGMSSEMIAEIKRYQLMQETAYPTNVRGE